MRAYVAAPLGRYAEAIDASDRLHVAGIECSCRWIYRAFGTQGRESLSDDEATLVHRENYEDLDASQMLLLMRYPGEGGEQLIEFDRALLAGKPIFWVGRPILTAKVEAIRPRPSVWIFETVPEAIEAIRKVVSP